MWKSALSAAALLAPLGAAAQDATEIDFVLNWIAGGDHAPYYYALQEGWYAEAGIDLNIEQGKGSAGAVQRTGIGQTDMGLADLGTALIAKGKGAEFTAVMNIYANSPQGMYWLKSSGIESVEDFPGRKIGNPPSDAARAMWPALAQAVGIDPDSVHMGQRPAQRQTRRPQIRRVRRDLVLLQHPPHLRARTGRRHGVLRLEGLRREPLRQLDHRQRRVPRREPRRGAELRRRHPEGLRRLRRDARSPASRRWSRPIPAFRPTTSFRTGRWSSN